MGSPSGNNTSEKSFNAGVPNHFSKTFIGIRARKRKESIHLLLIDLCTRSSQIFVICSRSPQIFAGGSRSIAAASNPDQICLSRARSSHSRRRFLLPRQGTHPNLCRSAQIRTDPSRSGRDPSDPSSFAADLLLPSSESKSRCPRSRSSSPVSRSVPDRSKSSGSARSRPDPLLSTSEEPAAAVVWAFRRLLRRDLIAARFAARPICSDLRRQLLLKKTKRRLTPPFGRRRRRRRPSARCPRLPLQSPPAAAEEEAPAAAAEEEDDGFLKVEVCFEIRASTIQRSVDLHQDLCSNQQARSWIYFIQVNRIHPGLTPYPDLWFVAFYLPTRSGQYLGL